MRIPDELLDCVCFIHTVRAGKHTLNGTAFFVGVDIGFGAMVNYAVTAKHCLYDKDGAPDQIALRLNRRSGSLATITTTRADWIQHRSADVAILQIFPDFSQWKFLSWPVTSVATKDFVVQRQIGAGDDVFVTGLLVHHPGKTRIMPIVRLGCIAALPEDTVRLKLGNHKGAQEVNDTVALLEVRSIGGLSGSPVFVHLPLFREMPKGAFLLGSTGVKPGVSGATRLLGIMHGFFPVGSNDPDGVSGGDENLNTGIAVVTLVDRMMDLINHPIQVGVREKLRHFMEKQNVPTPTGATPQPTPEFDEFEKLTRKLVRVPKKEIDKKRKAKG